MPPVPEPAPVSAPGSPLLGRLESVTPGVLFAAAAIAAVIEVTVHLGNYVIADGAIRALNSSKEWSYSHVLCTAAFVACAGACIVGARLSVDRRGVWRIAAALFVFVLVDNVTRLHVHVGAWPVYYAPILAALAIAVAVLAGDSELRGPFFAGLAVLVVSMAIHVLGVETGRAAGWWDVDGWPFPWSYQVLVAMKEGTELAGWVLVTPVLAQLAYRAHAQRLATPD